jgi:hypothetical protein
MVRISQFGIAIGALGTVLTFMGLFPGVTGINPRDGIGIVQIFVVLVGFSLLILGALLYVKYTFYVRQHSTLLQQVGIRLAFTGLILAGLVGMSDTLGFGSHPRTETGDTFFGTLQGAGIVTMFVIASIGVLVYTLAGHPEENE